VTKLIATVFAMICTIEPHKVTRLDAFEESFTGTSTSDPGPGLGSLRKTNPCRVYSVPFAYCTLARPLSAR